MNKQNAEELAASIKAIEDCPLTEDDVNDLHEKTGAIVSNIETIEDSNYSEEDLTALQEQTGAIVANLKTIEDSDLNLDEFEAQLDRILAKYKQVQEIEETLSSREPFHVPFEDEVKAPVATIKQQTQEFVDMFTSREQEKADSKKALVERIKKDAEQRQASYDKTMEQTIAMFSKKAK
jgi:hypothetical protein